MVGLQLLCCYCYSEIEFCSNCHYERVTDIARTRRHCCAETATANEFAAVATAIAYADVSVARVALLTVFKVTCCCDCNCYSAIATATSCFGTIATTNALSILRVPGDTATLQLLLLTSFAAVATVIAYADASVARLAVLTAVIVRMLLLHTQKA